MKLIERLGWPAIPDPCPHAAARCWLRPGGSRSRYTNASSIHGPSLDREHGCLHGGRRQENPNIWGKWLSRVSA